MKRLLALSALMALFSFTILSAQEVKPEDQPGYFGGSLLTETPEEGRALAIKIARITVKTIQSDIEVLKKERPDYSTDAEDLMRAAQVVAIEFQTIAAANNYWRDK